MKKIVFSLACLSATTIAFAGVIVTKNEGNIEDVSNIVVSSTEVSFMENGNSKSLPIDQVSAVLYDDGRYEDVKVMPQPTSQPIQETTSYSTNTSEQVVSNNDVMATTTQSVGSYDSKQWSKEFAQDYKAFAKAHKDEIKVVGKAIMTVAYKQKGSIFNFGGAKSIDQSAMEAYISAKMQGYSGDDAIRERNAVYIAEANHILESKGKK
ncbi:MAG: hypothetical protein MJZ64_06010 [Paludibacteraceae bacterium]|nr:hypothetical protein [Paludibacteraceae bacterium]